MVGMLGARRDAASVAVWQWRNGVKAALMNGTQIPSLRASKTYSVDDLVAELRIYGSNATTEDEIYNEALLECRDEVLAELKADDDANAITDLKEAALAPRPASLSDLTIEQTTALDNAVRDRRLPEELLRDPAIPIELRRVIAEALPAEAWSDELAPQRANAESVEDVTSEGDASVTSETGNGSE
jgi:hypothetical protein